MHCRRTRFQIKPSVGTSGLAAAGMTNAARSTAARSNWREAPADKVAKGVDRRVGDAVDRAVATAFAGHRRRSGSLLRFHKPWLRAFRPASCRGSTFQPWHRQSAGSSCCEFRSCPRSTPQPTPCNTVQLCADLPAGRPRGCGAGYVRPHVAAGGALRRGCGCRRWPSLLAPTEN